MFREYFGIEENPFSNTPDPNYLFMSERHQEALAHLQYGVQGSSGFVLLTGEVGTGKTTVCRCLVEQLPDHVDLALCMNPRMTEAELLAAICDELMIDTSYCQPDSLKDHMDALNRHLLDGHGKGRRAVLVIDEAQNLDYALLEQIRLLTNLETTSTKLLQIILIGQPELRDRLAESDLRQLSQRVSARYHLEPMTRDESDSYIRHRLQVGGLDVDLIGPGARAEIYSRSGGIPRLINSICERCLLGAYAAGKTRIDRSLARTAAAEVLGPAPASEETTTDPDGAGPETAPGPGGREGLPPVGLATGLVLAVTTVVVLLSTTTLDTGPPPTETVTVEQVNTASPATEPAANKSTVAPKPEVAAEPPQPETAAAPEPEVAAEPPQPETAAAPEPIVPAEPAPPEIAAPPTTTARPAAEPAADPVAAAPAEPVAQPVSSPPPDNEPITLDNLFRHPGLEGRLDAAVNRLFARWNRQFTAFSGLDPCADAERQGLKCLRRQGSWAQVEAINRPALISLVNGEGVRRYAVVSALDGGTAVLHVDDREITADPGALEALWSGEFLVLWEPLPGIRQNLRTGMAGSDVAWLRGRLAEILGQPADLSNARTFDDGLKKQVIAFQRRHRLRGDGVVGTLTQIHLSAAVGPSAAPALTSRP